MKNLVSKVKNIGSSTYTKVGVVGAMMFASSGAFALESDNIFKPMIDAIDVAPIKSGILAAASVVLGVTILVMAVRKIKGMIY